MNVPRWAWVVGMAVFICIVGCGPTPVQPPVSQREASLPPTAGAGDVPATPTTAVDKRERLAFDLQGSSDKLVFAHYFTPYPISLDNQNPSDDYYARQYLRPEGESGKFAEVGGLLRDRPIPRDARAGNWVVDDLRTEIRQAAAVGIDGFTINILSLDGTNWDRTRALFRAAEAENAHFRIMLMPDMTASTGRASAAELASHMAELARSAAVHRLSDGRLVVAPYKAEERSASWWKNFIMMMRRDHGEKVALLPVFHDPGPFMAAFAAVSYGFSEWGARNTQYVESEPNWAAKSHKLGRVWMAPVAAQDVRPSGTTFDEASNTATLRATWNRAINDGADLVQMITWNDYAETTHFAPSVAHGWAFLSLSAYFAATFQHAHAPDITRDAVYITHRLHDYRTQPTSGHRTMNLRGGTQPSNRVEVVTLLTSPATIEVRLGDKRQRYKASAGLGIETFPLSAGRVSVQVRRSGDIVTEACSPVRVRTSTDIQDLQYYAAMGLAGATDLCT